MNRCIGGGRDSSSPSARARSAILVAMVVHLLDGTYELFRHFYGRRAAAATAGSAPQRRAPHRARDHGGGRDPHRRRDRPRDRVVPQRTLARYKTGAGVDPALSVQFEPLEEALAAMGVAVWPMVEFEADDALAAAARIAAEDDAVDQVCIWTPDKDLAQSVGDRVVQVDRRAQRSVTRTACARSSASTGAHPRPARAGRRQRRRLSGHSPASAR